MQIQKGDEPKASEKAASTLGRYTVAAAVASALIGAGILFVKPQNLQSNQPTVANVVVPFHDPHDERLIAELQSTVSTLNKQITDSESARATARTNEAILKKQNDALSAQLAKLRSSPDARLAEQELVLKKRNSDLAAQLAKLQSSPRHLRVDVIPAKKTRRSCTSAAATALRNLKFIATIDDDACSVMGVRGPYKATITYHSNIHAAVVAVTGPDVRPLVQAHDELFAEFRDVLTP